MTTKQQIIDTHREHPDWTAGQTARHLGCSSDYIRATAFRCKLVFPKERDIEAETLALGHACRAAGITLRDIIDLAEKRKGKAA